MAIFNDNISELLNFLRKRITDPASRGTNTVDLFSGNGTETTFTLTKNNLMYIDSLKVGGTAQILQKDYTINWRKASQGAQIIFTTAPGAATENIAADYYYGSNWVMPAQPRPDSQMPRISVLELTSYESHSSIGDGYRELTVPYRLGIWVKSGKSYTISGVEYSGGKLMDYLASELQDNLWKNFTDMFNVSETKLTASQTLPFDEDKEIYHKELTFNLEYDLLK